MLLEVRLRVRVMVLRMARVFEVRRARVPVLSPCVGLDSPPVERRRGIGEVQHDFGARCGDAAEIEQSFGPASEASRKKNPQSRAQVEIFR